MCIQNFQRYINFVFCTCAEVGEPLPCVHNDEPEVEAAACDDGMVYSDVTDACVSPPDLGTGTALT